MKTPIIYIVAFLIFLTACSPHEIQSDNGIGSDFVVPKAKQQAITKLIKAHIKENYLKIDEKTIAYMPINENAENALKSMWEEKISLSKDALLVTVTLLHFNNNEGGTLHYIVDGDEIKYVYKETPEGFLEYIETRNPYSIENPFSKYEDTSIKKSYTSIDNRLIKEAPIYEQHNATEAIIVTVADSTLTKYILGSDIKKQSTYTEYSGLVPKALTLLDGSFYVLMCEEETIINEEDSEESITSLKSRKIVILSNEFRKISEIPLENTAVTGIISHNGRLVLVQDSTLNYFSVSGENITHINTVYLEHTVTTAIFDTLIDDEPEYLIATNGNDLYVYNNALSLIWRTHLGIPTYDATIFTGDLNGDGIKEIYMRDMMDTTIKYILTKREIKSSNEAIENGESIYPTMVGNKSAYIKMTAAGNISCEIYFEG